MELNSGSIDCTWNGFTIQGREDAYTWTVPYVDNSQVVLVKVGSPIKTLADLPGKFEMLGEIVMTETYGIGFKKGNVSLKDEVEATLKEIFADGTGAKIAEKYQIEPNALLLK